MCCLALPSNWANTSSSANKMAARFNWTANKSPAGRIRSAVCIAIASTTGRRSERRHIWTKHVGAFVTICTIWPNKNCNGCFGLIPITRRRRDWLLRCSRRARPGRHVRRGGRLTPPRRSSMVPPSSWQRTPSRWIRSDGRSGNAAAICQTDPAAAVEPVRQLSQRRQPAGMEVGAAHPWHPCDRANHARQSGGNLEICATG